MSDHVRLEIADGLATITLDSPANRNAMSRALTEGLSEHLATASADPSVRFIVLTHTGTVFCSGADLAEASAGDGATTGAAAALRIFRQIVDAPQPVIAVARGPVRAGGTGLVACADIALVADHVDFAFAEVAIGASPAVISIPLLARLDPRAVGRYVLTAEAFGAAEAQRIGLISEAVPLDAIDERLAAVLKQLRRTAPNAVSVTKKVATRALRADLEAYGQEMVDLSAHMFAQEEAQAGMRAFLSKARPPWVG